MTFGLNLYFLVVALSKRTLSGLWALCSRCYPSVRPTQGVHLCEAKFSSKRAFKCWAGEELCALTLCEMWTKETEPINFIDPVENHFYNASSCSSYHQYIRNSV